MPLFSLYLVDYCRLLLSSYSFVHNTFTCGHIRYRVLLLFVVELYLMSLISCNKCRRHYAYELWLLEVSLPYFTVCNAS